MIKYPIVLSIAGSDSSAGAGIQADLKTIAANGCYGASVITTITSQNTQGVQAVYDLPSSVIESQFNAVISDLDVRCIKLGMLNSEEIIEKVAALLVSVDIPFVLDPVMSAKDSTPLLENKALGSLLALLLPKAYLITPNIPEAEILTGLKIESLEDMKEACQKLEAENVLLKGGHLEGDKLVDVLSHDGAFEYFYHDRVNSKNTHGTGCTLASAIASHIALGYPLKVSCKWAIEYVQEAIKNSYDTGKGRGSLNHFYMIGDR